MEKFVDQQASAWNSVLGALLPARLTIRGARDNDVRAVAADKDPVVFALLATLLRWPDRDQPLEYTYGFDLVGGRRSSGVFRELPGNYKEVDEEQLLCGEPARKALKELLESRPPKEAELIAKLTEDQRRAGLLKEACTVEEMDKR